MTHVYKISKVALLSWLKSWKMQHYLAFMYNRLPCHVSNVQKINFCRKSVWYLIKVILECEMSIKRNYPRNASINGSSDNYSVRLRCDKKKKDRIYAPPPHHPLILNRNRQFVKSCLRCQSKHLLLTGGKTWNFGVALRLR